MSLLEKFHIAHKHADESELRQHGVQLVKCSALSQTNKSSHNYWMMIIAFLPNTERHQSREIKTGAAGRRKVEIKSVVSWRASSAAPSQILCRRLSLVVPLACSGGTGVANHLRRGSLSPESAARLAPAPGRQEVLSWSLIPAESDDFF